MPVLLLQAPVRPYLFNVGTNGKTLLQGVYESANGDPNGPWTKIATSSKLASSGSAQTISGIGKGYGPGIQAWYNQFLAVDPGNKDHVYLGLQEVYETQNAGASWNTIGRHAPAVQHARRRGSRTATSAASRSTPPIPATPTCRCPATPASG